MNGQKGAYRYRECGLTSVTLKDILVYRCANCGAEVPEIPAAGLLHRMIAFRLVCKKKLLTGSEARFLRKFCGYSVNELAEILGSSKQVIWRWEKEGYGPDTERVVRFLVVAKLTRELVGAPSSILKNVSVERLIGDLEETLKMLDENKTRASENYEISPEEIAKFSTGVGEESNELVAVLQ
jgi:transcriptional regulator with XRE-family HTH domain